MAVFSSAVLVSSTSGASVTPSPSPHAESPTNSRARNDDIRFVCIFLLQAGCPREQSSGRARRASVSHRDSTPGVHTLSARDCLEFLLHRNSRSGFVTGDASPVESLHASRFRSRALMQRFLVRMICAPGGRLVMGFRVVARLSVRCPDLSSRRTALQRLIHGLPSFFTR